MNEPIPTSMQPIEVEPSSRRVRLLAVPLAAWELWAAWFATRRWFVVLACLPLLVVSGILGWTAASGNMISTPDEARRYIQVTEQAARAGDQATVELCVRKLIGMPLEPALRFRVALFLAARGEIDRARLQMEQLAPSGARGYAQAHKWLAMDALMRHQADGRGQPYPDLVFHHAKIAANFLTDDRDAARIYALLLMRTGKLEDSLFYFERAAEQRPELLMTLAALQTQLGHADDGNASRSRAAAYFRSLVKKQPKNIAARINLVRVLLPNGEIQAAIDTVCEGLAIADDTNLRSALADCLMWQFDLLAPEQRHGSEGLRLIQQAVSLAPMHATTLLRMTALTAVSGDGNWGQIRDQLEQSLVHGLAPATCHLLLGDGYLQRGEVEKARMHLELAYQIDGRAAIVLNNLAWVLMFVEPIDLPRAEKLIDFTIELAPSTGPENIKIRETRGLVKLSLKKYSEAVADLEALLDHDPDHQRGREALAAAYEGQGDREQAEKQRQLAAERKTSNAAKAERRKGG